MKHYTDDWLTIYQGDVRAVLPTLPADSVDCIVTSPPYWGLRDYGDGGQLGLERTPEEYVANLVSMFRELRRVLKPSGTAWLNLGDSYSVNQRQGQPKTGSYASERPGWSDTLHERNIAPGLKPKDLVGIPWRVAFALQADGWYLRSDIIWAKPNPMPESVTDRPTKAHEYLFLLTKAARYYYDADAVREPHIEKHLGRYSYDFWPEGTKEANGGGRPNGASNTGGSKQPNPAGRNLRSVWTIATRPYPGAHFAVFPPELPERCIKAGSSERGVCPECGAPWERVVEREGGERYATGKSAAKNGVGLATAFSGYTDGSSSPTFTTIGWQPSCRHYDAGWEGLPPLRPSVVLDPFAGSGTTGMVANRLSRRAILIDLNGDYLKQQLKRNAQTPLGLGA